MVVQDFEPIAIIGRGAFGEVRVCRDKQTREVVAVKKMKKQDMIVKNQLVQDQYSEYYYIGSYSC